MNKTIVINGSPKTDRGNTAMVLAPFLDGMVEGGTEVELLYASRLDVKPCSCGQMHCWGRHPGECVIKDDMQELYPKLKCADTLVLATPVYVPLPGRMQDVVNRLVPLIDPYVEWRAGRTRARFRSDVHIQRIALVATGGWWEKQNMNLVMRIAEELAENASVEFAGAVLRPHAYLMVSGDGLTEDGRDVAEAAHEAGYQLATRGVMNKETLDHISRPLISEEEWRSQWNG